MSLSLSLLGVFQASLNGQPITEFYSSKVRALLAYLAVEAGRVHSRPVLAAFLWPDWADRAALGNLRFSLSKLRQAINDQDSTPSFLLINRDSVQLNPSAELSLDVRLFEQALQASRWEAADVDGQPEPVLRSALGRLTTALELYRGSFLEGFSAGDSGAFEEWALIKREELEREARSALHGLTALHSRLGDYAAAERCVRRLLEMDPWDELANRRLMSVLLQNGQRNAALRHYTTYREALAKELGAEPAEETVAHYELIKGGQPGRTTVTESPGPPLVARPSSPPSAAGPARTFVAREPQLALLDGYLDQALAGQGVVAFVSGEAGSGKTVLLCQFARRALTQHRDLLVAGGDCNAYTGLGDPYLPFCEIAQALAGSVEAQRSGDASIAEHARRAPAAARVAAEVLVEKAPDLVDRFIPAQRLPLLSGSAAVERSAATFGAAQGRLNDPARRRANNVGGPRQADLFSQYTDFLIALSRIHPLLLTLDDLQWADNGSLSLLFHLGRRLSGARILIVGAYRPEEVAAGRGGARHPLATIVNELRQVHGSAEVNLDQADGRHFVSALLDSEANRLGTPFRDTLYHHTDGHPLFTVELLRDLQERGAIVRDATGAWIETRAVSRDGLPPRVEAVIAERIQRLPPVAQALLAAASVEGEEFTSEVVAEVLQMEGSAVIGQLGDLLGKQHRLVRGSGTLLPIDAIAPLSRYRFQHSLFQMYVYDQLDPVQRRHLHGLTGEALERLYGAKMPGMAVRLAHHFERAGAVSRAVDYLQAAGDQALWVAACQEALAHFNRGLALVATLPKTPARARRELRLRLSLAGPLALLHCTPDALRADTAADAAALSRDAGGGVQTVYALFVEASARRDSGDCRRALELGQQMLALAGQCGDRSAAMLAHYTLGGAALFSGDSVLGLAGLEAALRLHSGPEDDRLGTLVGVDLKAVTLSFLAAAQWALGYPGQAAVSLQQALDRAQELGQPATLAVVLIAEIWLALFGRTGEDLRPQIETLQGLVHEKGIEAFRLWTTVFDGWLAAEQGHPVEGVRIMRDGIAAWGPALGAPGLLATVAETCLRYGMYDEGLSAVDDALTLVEGGMSHYFEAELCRLKGALMLAGAGPDSAGAAERWFLRAIDVARSQQSRSWELRASTDLARLWRQQGQGAEAQRLLSCIYGGFTEGLETPGVREARALLEEFAQM